MMKQNRTLRHGQSMIRHKIWLENEKSIEPKLELMKKNKLAGTAAWALGQETSETWQLILKYVN